MISWNREGILFSPFLSLWVLYVRSQATVCYLLHAGLCPQQHTNGQSAHCLSFGSVTVDAVSLILHSWRLKRGKNHQRSFLASPDITSALCVFFLFFFTHLWCKHLLKEKTYSLPLQGPSILCDIEVAVRANISHAKCCLLCKCGRN